MQKHIQHNKDERTQFFRKIYLSLYLKGFERVTKGFTVWEVSWRLNRTATYWPHSYGHNSVSFPFSWAAQPGPGGPTSLGHGPHSSIFSPTDLNFLSPGLYNNLMSTYFLRASQFRTQFNPSIVKVDPDLLISSTGCTCYLHRCISSFDSLVGSDVTMQHELWTADWTHLFCRGLWAWTSSLDRPFTLYHRIQSINPSLHSPNHHLTY